MQMYRWDREGLKGMIMMKVKGSDLEGNITKDGNMRLGN